MKERKSKVIRIGNVLIGGDNKIAIQSMTNTKTSNIEETIAQINELFSKGCNIVRVACLDMDDAKALKEITKKVSIPIVADIHFDYKIALEAINNGISKLRLNPGNIGNINHIKEIVDACKDKNIPIRIGVNTGSLDKDILNEYGNTASALVKSAMDNVKILEDLDFYNIVISVKASNVLKTIEACELLHEKCDYPLHLGVTEAGLEYQSIVKSSIAIGSLLVKGIGDTIRVSITGDPVREVVCAKELLSSIDMYDKPLLISCPTCGRCEYDMIPIANIINEYLNEDRFSSSKIKVAIMGCVVNGPGEAKDADVGVAGGKKCAILFKHGKTVSKIAEDEIVETLKKEIWLITQGYTYSICTDLDCDIARLRTEVFMNEQGFLNEFDEIDKISKFVKICKEGKIVATGRLYENNEGYHIGRICVKKSFRKLGLGSIVISILERNIENNKIIINAQASSTSFYKKNGYKLTNKQFLDENVLHEQMIKIR